MLSERTVRAALPCVLGVRRVQVGGVGVPNLDLRVRLFGSLLRRLPGTRITKMTVEDIAKVNRRMVRRNRVMDALCGPIAEGVRVEDLTMPGPGGDVPLRVYRPTRAASGGRPVIVNYHAGGWTLGNLEMADWLCSQVAGGVNAVVVSVAYRLAPHDPFPAAVLDSYAALEWAVQHASSLGVDPDHLAVMGDSSGGNLAAVVCLLTRDRAGPRVCHQTLIYPATDLAGEWPSRVRHRKTPFTTVEDLNAFVGHYLGPADPEDWRASPLRAEDHAGLPPALVQVAQYDPLHDEGVAYAESLRSAGVPVQLTEYAGMPHGYLSFPGVCRGASKAIAEVIVEQVRFLHAS